MNKVLVLADSTVDLSPELFKKYNIERIPLNVNFGEESFKDGIDITPEQIYERVKNGSPLPSTSAIAPGVFKETLEKYINDGYDVVYVGIGSKLSTTYQNFMLVASEFEEGRAFAVDSESLSTGSGLLALKMAKLRDEGKSAKEIFDIVQPLAAKVSAKFVLDRLDYMKKGGRCSAMTALLGHLFHIHPILIMKDGKLVVEKKSRGLLKNAYNEMVDELKNDLPNIDFDHVMITHAGINQPDLDYIYNEVSKIVDPSIISITQAGCVISSHCGFGTVGILYIKK